MPLLPAPRKSRRLKVAGSGYPLQPCAALLGRHIGLPLLSLTQMALRPFGAVRYLFPKFMLTMSNKIFYFFYTAFLLALAAPVLSAQGTNCNNATRFCTNTLDPFPAGVGQPAAPAGNNYDCLFTQPNPAWFTMTISNNGNVDFFLDNTNNEDIDFIVWGPFPSEAAASTACGNLGNGGATGGVVDCSYSGVSLEQVQIPNAQAGEVYVLMVTNFSNQPTNIFSTANTGTGGFLCDCDLDVDFFLTPIPQNAGVMTDTTATSAEFVLCAPTTPSGTAQQLFFTIGIGALNPTDSLGLHLPTTTIANSFQTGNFNVFGPIYPVVGRFDTMELTIIITGEYSEIGIHDFDLGIVNYATTTCIQPLPIRVIIPGVDVTATDTVLCPSIAHEIPLSAVVTTASSAAGTGSYQWVQAQGAATTITTPTSINPTISLPSTTADGDIFRYALTYTDATGCTTSDTFALRMQTHPLQIDLTADRTLLCNSGLPESVQLQASISNTAGIVPANATYTWTNPATLSNDLIANPIATLAGSSSADSLRYIVQVAYGACLGSDTIMMRFRNTDIVTTGNNSVICPNGSAPISARLTDTASTSSTNCNAYTVQPIAFAPVAGTGTAVTAFNSVFGFPNNDDGVSDPLPIGFSFQFYCQDYTQFYIGTNGFISFTLPTDNGTGAGIIPQAANINNLIALAWADLDPSSGGGIDYFTTGTAPNRQLIVNFRNVPHFSAPDSVVTVQAILYEGTNLIELHNTRLNQGGFFSPELTQGVENAAGTIATAVPGRNATAFTAINDAFRFSPATIVVVAPITYAWSPAAGLNSSTVHNPIASPASSTLYSVTISNGGCTYTETVNVQTQTALPAPSAFCISTTANSVTFGWNSVGGSNGYEYSINGINWTNSLDTFITISGIASNTTVNLFVRAVNAALPCPIGALDTAACTASGCALDATLTSSPITGCDIENLPSNGRLTISNIQGSAPYLFALSNGMSQSDSLFSNLATGAYTLTVSELNNPSCTATFNFSVGNEVGDVRLNAFIQLAGKDTAYVFSGDTLAVGAGFNRAGTQYTWNAFLAQGFMGNVLYPADSANAITIPLLTTESDGAVMGLVITAESMGCINSDTVYMVVLPATFGGMPSAFTPNGDGENDLFRPAILEGAQLRAFRIYNRWGQLVYNSTDLVDGGWDGTINGTAQPRDAYIYYIEFQLGNDPTPQKIRGEFTLIR